MQLLHAGRTDRYLERNKKTPQIMIVIQMCTKFLKIACMSGFQKHHDTREGRKF